MKTRKFAVYTLAAVTVLLSPLLWACDGQDSPVPDDGNVPEGMVEINPVLPGMFSAIPRNASQVRPAASRTYDPNTDTNTKLEGNTLLRLPHEATVWLIAESQETGQTKPTLVKKSYAVYNPTDDENMSYLVPCKADPDGKLLTTDGTPLYLKKGKSYLFYAISPARKLDDEKFKQGEVGFQVKNGEYFYANDCRYEQTKPIPVNVKSDNSEDVQVVTLSPIINQTAELKFQIQKGTGVHDLGIQPSGIQISGLQNDSSEGSRDGIHWHMSRDDGDEPITLQHNDKDGIFNSYDYTVDADGKVNIEVPVLPMYSISKPVIVVFRLKVNGVPTSYEMMLNEKDFKAGYSYGYRGTVSIEKGVNVITWQYVSWETEVPLPNS